MNMKNVFDAIKIIEQQVQESLITRASTDVYNLILLNEHFIRFHPGNYSLDNYINNNKLKTTIYIMELHSKVIIGKMIIIEQNKLRVIYNSLRLPKGSHNHEANQEAQNLLTDYITSNQYNDAQKSSHLVTQLSDDIRLLEINSTRITITKLKFYFVKSAIWSQAFFFNFGEIFFWIVRGCGSGDTIGLYFMYFLFMGFLSLMSLPHLFFATLFWSVPLTLTTVASIIVGVKTTYKEARKIEGLFYSKPRYYFKSK
jgi:hypothetical protein